MRPWLWPALLVALAVVSAAAVAFGTVPLAPAQLLDAVAGRGDPATAAIVRDLRLPRVVTAGLVGAGLAMSGAALQGGLRNALAEPYLLGVSGGAAVGAVVAVWSGADGTLAVAAAAFAGALAAVAVVLTLARAAGGRADPRVLLMAGVVLGAFANATIMLALANAPPDTVRGALWWMMGSVSDARWAQVPWLAASVAGGAAALLAFGRDIDVLALGEDPAAALGVDVERAARRVYVVASLLAAATVAACGLVGFVGLIVPHLVRGPSGRAHRRVIAASGAAGAILVIGADLAARTIATPAELPLGAITALVGVPFFLAQLRRAR